MNPRKTVVIVIGIIAVLCGVMVLKSFVAKSAADKRVSDYNAVKAAFADACKKVTALLTDAEGSKLMQQLDDALAAQNKIQEAYAEAKEKGAAQADLDKLVEQYAEGTFAVMEAGSAVSQRIETAVENVAQVMQGFAPYEDLVRADQKSVSLILHDMQEQMSKLGNAVIIVGNEDMREWPDMLKAHKPNTKWAKHVLDMTTRLNEEHN